MARITLDEANAWGERTKLQLSSLDVSLLSHIENEVLARVGVAVDTSTWVDSDTTPDIVRTAISKFYFSWEYDRAYSEDADEGNKYAARLAANAEMLISGIIDGTIELPGAPEAGLPGFYPTDLSSSQEPSCGDYSLGPAKFSMGTTF